MPKQAAFSLDRVSSRASVSPTPFRQPNRMPTPYLVIDPAHIETAADLLAGRIRAIRYRQECATYLYVDPVTLNAYAIPECKPAAEQWVRGQFGWLVGVYDLVHRKDAPMLKPTPEGIAEDLREHLTDAEVLA